MNCSASVVLVVVATFLMLTQSFAFRLSDRSDEETGNIYTKLELLDELVDSLRADMQSYSDNDILEEKRASSTGNGRYGSQSVGSKLMALKQAPDWNGPGRKKRST